MNQIDTISNYVSSHTKLLEKQVSLQLKRAGIFLAVNITGAACILVSALYYIYFVIRYVVADSYLNASSSYLIFFGVVFGIGALILGIGNYALSIYDSESIYKKIDRKRKQIEESRKLPDPRDQSQGVKNQSQLSEMLSFKNIIIVILSVLLISRIPALKNVFVKKSMLDSLYDKAKNIDFKTKKEEKQEHVYRDLLLSICIPLMTKVVQGFFESKPRTREVRN